MPPRGSGYYKGASYASADGATLHNIEKARFMSPIKIII